LEPRVALPSISECRIDLWVQRRLEIGNCLWEAVLDFTSFREMYVFGFYTSVHEAILWVWLLRRVPACS
jgi:hypothetical protein